MDPYRALSVWNNNSTGYAADDAPSFLLHFAMFLAEVGLCWRIERLCPCLELTALVGTGVPDPERRRGLSRQLVAVPHIL
eukprot:3562581-Rhodomonas_salina.3